MGEQNILIASESYCEIDRYLEENSIKNILLVCDSSLKFLKIDGYFKSLKDRTGVEVAYFSDFQPNPLYESVVEGVKLFHDKKCEAIFAVGGGSAIDVAKCIKLYSNMDHTQNYLKQEIVPNDVKLLAIPTTAGTGSEATRYAVIYFEGVKQSVTDYSIIPSTVVMDASALSTLPAYQKKATMMDALCHAIESFWSMNSTDESKQYSKQAIELILGNMDAYQAGDDSKNEIMLKSANIAGKAINITQTTAGHAMCYKLTSLYGIAHGHAAALCVAKLWPYMVEHLDKCIDSRGQEYLNGIFSEIASAMGCVTVQDAIVKFQGIVDSLGLGAPEMKDESDYEKLRTSVNPVRLKNNPVGLDEDAIDGIYHEIFRGA